jgi:hypothetical protein
MYISYCQHFPRKVQQISFSVFKVGVFLWWSPGLWLLYLGLLANTKVLEKGFAFIFCVKLRRVIFEVSDVDPQDEGGCP